jgi:Protein of unknown function (DUF3313)
MPPATSAILLRFSLLAMSMLCSCASPAMKAPPAKLSAFLAPKPALTDDRKTTPYALSGGTLTAPQRGIYIAPVSLTYLRSASKMLTKSEGVDSARNQAAEELAAYGRTQFMRAFEKSTSPRYQLRTTPDRDCLVLDLALTELNRNTFTGAVSRFAMGTVALPGVDAVFAKTTRGLKGNIAIEGKLRNPTSGEILYQFADSEESRSAFLLPVTDFTPYGQAREALRNWATQFEELTRAAPGQRVKDIGVMSLF